MGRIFLILAFMTCLGLTIPAVNAISPYSPAYQSPSSNVLNTPMIIGAAGCASPDANGNANCTASIGGSSGSNGVLGPITNSVFIFGNFFAAANFLVQLSVGVTLPGWYVLQWAGGANNPAAVYLAAMIQGLVWLAYANDLFYIFSGRWVFPP